jgi:hypothetical protein
MSKTESHGGQYLFDLKKRETIGALDTAWAISLNKDQMEALCCIAEIGKGNTLSEAVSSVLHDLSGGRYRARGNEYAIHYWIVPLREGTPTYLGEAHEKEGLGSIGHRSPDDRYWHVQTSCDDRLLVDLERKEMLRLDPVRYRNGGWWSDTELIFKTEENDLRIYDVETKREETLLTLDQLLDFLKEQGLSDAQPELFRLFQEWNGKGYSFYISSNISARNNGKDWLIGIDKQTRQLRLKERSFDYHRLGHLNYDGSLYLYSGEKETGDSNAVYVADLANSKVRTLIPGDTNENYFSLPNWYGGRIIFVQQGALWIIDADGENREQLFPPAAGKNKRN